MSNSPIEESTSRDGHWLFGLGVGAGSRAEIASDAEEKLRLLVTASELLARSVEELPDHQNGWLLLGVALGYRSDQARDETRRQDLRSQEIDAYRRATDADPNYAQAWNNLSSSLITQGHATSDPSLWEEALGAARTSVALRASRYNLACALALTGNTEEALSELEGCLARAEISLKHVQQDSDWTALREDPRFQEILRAAEERVGTTLPTAPGTGGS